MEISHLDDLAIPQYHRSTVPPEHLERVAATLDLPAEMTPRDAVPLLWHWTYLTPTVPTSALGPDGHPRLATTGTELPRRMFAGGDVRGLRRFRTGVPAHQEVRLLGTETKVGSSGPFLIVSIRSQIRQDDQVVVEEDQSLIYRQGPSDSALPVGNYQPPAEDGSWRERVTVDKVLLFRFSALTFNSHRIHYDADYAQSEGFPQVVVHGPLTAMLLGESVRERMGPLVHFRFRATAPLFADIPFWLIGRAEGQTVTLSAVRTDGETAMRAVARVRS